jgi:tetratricopeptide (TPR) repeat protein
MLDSKTPVKERQLVIKPYTIPISFGGKNQFFTVKVPSPEEMEQLRDDEPMVSIAAAMLHDPLDLVRLHKLEYDQLYKRYEKYKDSSTFNYRLSNLAKLSGNLAKAEELARVAAEIDDADIFNHELGDLLIEKNGEQEALEIFSNCDLDKDLYANLRIAYLMLKASNLEKVEVHIAKALDIDELNFEARLFAGALCVWKQDWEKSIYHSRIARESGRESAPLNVNMGYAYARLGEVDKAIKCLLTAILLDPLNEGAVCLYSDLIHHKYLLKGDERLLNNSINKLECYVDYESSSERALDRIARGYYLLWKTFKKNNYYLGAVKALGKLITVNSSVRSYSNLGVIHWSADKFDGAEKYFGVALKVAEDQGESRVLPVTNLLGLLIRNRKYRDVQRLSGLLLDDATNHERDDGLFDRVKLQYVIGLEGSGERAKAALVCEGFIGEGVSDENIYVEMLCHLISHYSHVNKNLDKLEGLKQKALSLNKTNKIEPKSFLRLLNNVIFGDLIHNKLAEAEALLPRISMSIHKDPYATATLGLYHLKKGDIEKGIKLYKRGISILSDKKEVDRFKQRMHYELGLKYIELGERSKGLFNFRKAKSFRYGYDFVNKQMLPLLNAKT